MCLVRLNRRDLIAQHAESEQPKKDALHHQEDHQQVVLGAGVALVAAADAHDVLNQHEDHGVHAGHKHPENKEQEELVIAHTHAVIHPSKENKYMHNMLA